MKSYLLLFTILLFWSCSNSESTPTSSSTEEAPTSNATSSNSETTIDEASLEYEENFVAALSGLRMRKEPSLSSEKMDVIPYGETVYVADMKGTEIPPVSGIKGQMVRVKYGEQVGYMFDGFLNYFPMPEKGKGLKSYVRKLKIFGLEASQTEEMEEITHTQTITLPTVNFEKAFLVAKALGWIVGDFDLPDPKNPNKITARDAQKIKKTVKGMRMSEEAVIDNEFSFQGEMFYNYDLPHLRPEVSDFNATFSFTNQQFDGFQLGLYETYRGRVTKIVRGGNFYTIIFKDVGE